MPQSGQRAGDLIEQNGLDVLPEQVDRGYDHDREEARDHCVFNRGGAALVGKELQSRSRSIATSGKSAGGMGRACNSRGRTHLIAAASIGEGIPPQRRQINSGMSK
jgi:hypothetical protein